MGTGERPSTKPNGQQRLPSGDFKAQPEEDKETSRAEAGQEECPPWRALLVGRLRGTPCPGSTPKSPEWRVQREETESSRRSGQGGGRADCACKNFSFYP